jgi:hypothetical protein
VERGTEKLRTCGRETDEERELHEKRNNFKETGKIIKAKIRKLI